MPTIPTIPTKTSIRISVSSLPVFAGLVHLFFDAAFLDEVLLEPFYQSDYELIALVYQSDGNVGYCLVAALLYLLAVDGRVQMCTAKCSSLLIAWVLRPPVLQASDAQIVFVVEEQFV